MIFASLDLDKAHLEDFLESLPKIKESMFDGVEICLWEDMGAYSKELKEALNSLELKANVHNDIMKIERGFDDCKNRLKNSLRFKEDISAKLFISHPIKPYTEHLEETRGLFDSVDGSILVENVKGIKLSQIAALGRPLVLDIGNLINNGEYYKLGEYQNIKWVHIHDYKNGKDHLPLGEGKLDLDSLIKRFSGISFTIELGSEFRDWKNLNQDYRNSIDFITNSQISQTSYGKNVRLAHLVKNVGCEKFNLAVDLGCGEGYLLHNIPAKIKKGYDLSPLKIFNDITYLRQDITTAFEEDADLIICSEVIEHLENDSTALNKLYNSLRPGGKIFLTTINKNTSKDKSQLDKERSHLRRYGNELKSYMEIQGFKTSSFYPFRSEYYYAHKGNFKNYNLEKDISQGKKDASGWVYFGRKENKK